MNSRQEFFGTPIFLAALRLQNDVVQTLLKHKVDLSATSRGLGSALHCACFSGDINIVQSLLQHGDTLERCELVYPCALAEVASMRVGASLATYNCIGMASVQVRCSPVLHAAQRHHFDLLRVLRFDHHHDYTSSLVWRLPPQQPSKTVVANSESSTYSAWSSFGFPLTLTTSSEHLPMYTMLMWAAASLDLDLIDHLLAAGASATVQDADKSNALSHAAVPFHGATFGDVTKCVQKLVEAGSTVTSDIERLVSASHPTLTFHATLRWGASIHTTFVSAFLGAVASVEERRETSRKALIAALSHPMCPESSIKLLCEHAVEPSQNLARRQAAILCFSRALNCGLRHAATAGTIAALLEHGAIADRSVAGPLLPPTGVDVLPVQDVTSDMSKHSSVQYLPEHTAANASPLSIAIEAGASLDVVTMLLEHGADPYVPESQFGHHPGLTPFEIARRYGRQSYTSLFEKRTASVSRSWLVKLSAIPVPSFLRDSGRK